MKMKEMKSRYILLLLVAMTSMQICADDTQDFAPLLPMTSTSAMVGSGSTIPLAAEDGVFAYDESVITKEKTPSGPRRAGWGDPMPLGPVPVGATPWLLMLLLCVGYAVGTKFVGEKKKERNLWQHDNLSMV